MYIVLFIQKGATPVFMAANQGHTATVQVLAEAGADVNILETDVSIVTLYPNTFVLHNVEGRHS